MKGHKKCAPPVTVNFLLILIVSISSQKNVDARLGNFIISKCNSGMKLEEGDDSRITLLEHLRKMMAENADNKHAIMILQGQHVSASCRQFESDRSA